MRLDLSCIVVDNFRSFVEPAQLEFRDYANPGLHFIRGRNEDEPRLGSNGSGKSSLISGALTWGLYGKTAGGLRSPDIIPWETNVKGTAVTIGLLADGRPLIVDRLTNPNQLLLNNESVDQAHIDKAIGLSFDTFTNTILLAQGRPLFFDLAPKEKMDLFSSALDLDRWEERSKHATATVVELEKLASEDRTELTALDAQIAQVEQSIKDTNKLVDEWTAAVKDRLSAIDENLEGLQAELEAAQLRLGDAELKYDSAATEWRVLLDEIAELSDLLRAAEQAFVKAEREALTYKAQIDQLQADLSTLAQAKTCPTCGQPLKAAVVSTHKAEMQGQLRLARAKLTATNLTDLRASITKLEQRLDKAHKNAETFKGKAGKAQAQARMHEPTVITLQTRIREIRKAREEKVDEQNPYRTQLKTLRTQHKQLVRQEQDLQEDLKTLEKKIERNRFWVKGFKDVRLHIIDEVLQELELSTNAMLADVGLLEWEVRYSVEKETSKGTIVRGLNVTVLSPHNNKPVRWECWSGGESQRLRLIGTLALSDVLLNRAGIEAGFEILDEPTRGLSDVGIRDLCEYLADRAQQLGRQTWLIDHRAMPSTYLASSLTVVKTRRGSHIEHA